MNAKCATEGLRELTFMVLPGRTEKARLQGYGKRHPRDRYPPLAPAPRPPGKLVNSLGHRRPRG
eukprot:7248904-Pyramimonas_sp.AAC.1